MVCMARTVRSAPLLSSSCMLLPHSALPWTVPACCTSLWLKPAPYSICTLSTPLHLVQLRLVWTLQDCTPFRLNYAAHSTRTLCTPTALGPAASSPSTPLGHSAPLQLCSLASLRLAQVCPSPNPTNLNKAFPTVQVDWGENVAHLQIRDAAGGGVARGVDGSVMQLSISLKTCQPVTG